MSADVQRFAQVVLSAFEERGLATVEEIERAGGPSSTTLTTYRAAAVGEKLDEVRKPRRDTQRKIEKAAEWLPGSTLRVWAGGDPELAINRGNLNASLPGATFGASGLASSSSSGAGAATAVTVADQLAQLEARVARLEAHVGLSEIPPAAEVSSSEPLALGGTHLDDPQEAQRRG